MARLDRFASVFDEFQNGFDRGVDRQLKMAALVQNARASYAQEERARQGLNLDIAKYNLAEPTLARRYARDNYILDKIGPQLDTLEYERRRMLGEQQVRDTALQSALQRNDFAEAKRITGVNYRRNQLNGRIETSVNNVNWTVGGIPVETLDRGQTLIDKGQQYQIDQLNWTPPATTPTNTGQSVVFQKPAKRFAWEADPVPMLTAPIGERVGASTVGDPQAPLVQSADAENPYGNFMGKGARKTSVAQGVANAGASAVDAIQNVIFPQVGADISSRIAELQRMMELEPDSQRRAALRAEIAMLYQQRPAR